jgi:hypothetical protein
MRLGSSAIDGQASSRSAARTPANALALLEIVICRMCFAFAIGEALERAVTLLAAGKSAARWFWPPAGPPWPQLPAIRGNSPQLAAALVPGGAC